MSTSVPVEPSLTLRLDEWRRRARAWVATWGREAVPFLGIAGAALVLRLIGLDDSPLIRLVLFGAVAVGAVAAGKVYHRVGGAAVREE